MTEFGKPSGTRPCGSLAPTFGAKSFADFVSASWNFDIVVLGEGSFANLFALRICQMERRELHILRHGAALLLYCSRRRLIFICVSAADCECQNCAGRHETS
jgi:hypothetical protein